MNLKVRLKNKTFWLAFVPALLLLAQVVAVPFGYKFDIQIIGKELTDVVNALFAVLALLGVAIDPTTQGVKDSTKALTYMQPKENLRNQAVLMQKANEIPDEPVQVVENNKEGE